MSSTPLLSSGSDMEEARPSMLGADALSARQQRVDERIRTLCLVVLSVAVVGVGAYQLREILMRLVLALALRYLLTPLIDCLSCLHGRCRYKLPRPLAIVISLALTGAFLALGSIVLARSIGTFAAHADQYSERAEALLEAVLNATDRFDLLGPDFAVPLQNRTGDSVQRAIATEPR